MGSMIRLAAGHAARQARVAANGASTARVDQASDFIGEHPTDELSYQRGVRTIASETEAQGRNSGWSTDQIKEPPRRMSPPQPQKRVVGLAKTDAIGAQSLADAAAKTGALLRPMPFGSKPQSRPTSANKLADHIHQVLAGRKEAMRMRKPRSNTSQWDDPSGCDHEENRHPRRPVQRLRSPADHDDYGLQKRVERDSDNQNLVTVGKAMLKANAEGSPRPVN